MEQKKFIILALALVVVLVLAGAGYKLLAPQAALSGTLGGTQSTSGSGASSTASQPAPDFTVYDANGGKVTLAGLMEAGKPAVLYFWASTCPPCRSDMPDFEAAFQKYGGEVQFIMVDAVGSMNGETRQAGSDYVAEQGFTFPVYFDDEQSAVMAFGLRAFPTTFFLHADGTIAAYGEGMLDTETLEKGIGMILPDAVQGAA